MLKVPRVRVWVNPSHNSKIWNWTRTWILTLNLSLTLTLAITQTLTLAWPHPYAILHYGVVYDPTRRRRVTRSSAIAGRLSCAKACQRLLKWTWKWPPRLKWLFQMYFKVIKCGTSRKLVYHFLLVLCSDFCRITHHLRKIWCETVQWALTWKYRQGHRHLYHLNADVWFLISSFSFCGCVPYNFRDIRHGRVKRPSNIIQGHQNWHQSKASVMTSYQ